MPVLGELRTAKAFGLSHYHKYIWAACLDCGKQRWVCLRKGQPNSLRCIKCANTRTNQSEAARARQSLVRADRHGRWKGGRYISRGRNPYVKITLQPNDPFFIMASTDGSCREHRFVMAQHLDRCLESWEVVHHRNGDGLDNRLENLELMHTIVHHHLDSTLKAQLTRLQKQVRALKARIAFLEAENRVLRTDNEESFQTAS